MASNYTSLELEKLRQKLPKNWSTMLVEITGMANSTVRKTLYGLNNNDKIVEAAIELAQKHQQSLLDNKKFINDEN